MNIVLFNKIPRFKNIYEKDNNDREINAYKFQSVIAGGHNLYYPNVLLHCDNELILP